MEWQHKAGNNFNALFAFYFYFGLLLHYSFFSVSIQALGPRVYWTLRMGGRLQNGAKAETEGSHVSG